jgi:alkanesulfonate monooxygenase SsuD/methylene tetrahydromethanopterin reductase-like flavin-dependent oxidoreductase (luciferase family)
VATRDRLAVGLALGGAADARSWQEALALAGWAEELALDSLWLPEGHLRAGSTSSPLLGLAAFAARTQRIRLGTSSLLISIHPPERVAAEVAALDRLSGGRVVLGLGRGFDRAIFRAFGVDPRDKRDRFDEALDAILSIWAGTAESGPALEDARPLQRPHPPLYVAAFGAKGLAQAARRGLPYLASPLESLDALARNFALHAEQLPPPCDPASLPVAVMRTVHVAADRAEAERVRRAAEAEFAALAARAAGGPLAARAAGAAAERVLVGEAGEVAAALARYRDRLGLDLLVVRAASRVGPAEQRASLERLVGDVLSRIGVRMPDRPAA